MQFVIFFDVEYGLYEESLSCPMKEKGQRKGKGSSLTIDIIIIRIFFIMSIVQT